MQRDPVLAVKTLTAPWNSRVKLTFRVEGGLHYIRSNRAPYFSLMYWQHRKGLPNQCQSGGADDNTILQHFPQFADLAAINFSDINGVPMYAYENGWYMLAGSLPYYGGAQYHDGNGKRSIDGEYRTPTPLESLQSFAHLMRIDIDTAKLLRDEVMRTAWNEESETFDWPAGRAFFAAWIEEQRPRWKAEAEAVIERHNLRVYGDHWENSQ